MTSLLVAATSLALVACQHAPPPSSGSDPSSWQVLERVGEVRTAKATSSDAKQVWPGETIAHGSRVTTGEGAFLILASESMQLTVGADTALILPSSAGAPTLVVDRGSLRARLSAAPDRTMRIETTHLQVSASHAAFTLQVGRTVANLSVEEGRAVLSTADGQHRTSLAAGGAAKIDPTGEAGLLVRPASGDGFSRAIPMPARSPGPTEPAETARIGAMAGESLQADEAAAASANPFAGDLEGTRSSPASVFGAEPNRSSLSNISHPLSPVRIAPPSTSPYSTTLAILPASRPKERGERQPSDTSISGSPPANAATRVSKTQPLISPPPENRPAAPMAESGRSVNGRAIDPVRAKFDQMTEGLVEDL